jgi:hypothetical protein
VECNSIPHSSPRDGCKAIRCGCGVRRVHTDRRGGPYDGCGLRTADCQERGGGVGSCVGLDEGRGGYPAEGAQWRGVSGTIRFPLMSEEYLRDRVVDTVREGVDDSDDVCATVWWQKLRAKAALRKDAVFEFQLLGRKALKDHVGLVVLRTVRWEEEGGALRLREHKREVGAIMACEEQIRSGSSDGTIRVWTPHCGAGNQECNKKYSLLFMINIIHKYR